MSTARLPDSLTLPVIEVDGHRHIVLSQDPPPSLVPTGVETYVRLGTGGDAVDTDQVEDWWPEPGTLWEHSSGREYEVTGFLNVHTSNPRRYPVMVTYRSVGAVPGRKWTRPLHEWYRSFAPMDLPEEQRNLMRSFYSTGMLACGECWHEGTYRDLFANGGKVRGKEAAAVIVNPGHSDWVRVAFAQGWEAMLTVLDT